MPTEVSREWVVVDGDRILYHADDKPDAEAWRSENDRGEVIAVPEGGVPWI